MVTAIDDERSLRFAGLRTRLVSRLTGLSEARLRYWHSSELLEATNRPGSRGIPRLYSWVDYMRLRVVAGLLDGVDTRRVRRAVDFLDKHVPEWYLLPESPRAASDHVLARMPDEDKWFLADEVGQFLLWWPEDLVDLAAAVSESLDGLVGAGADLGQLRAFADVVVMRPGLNAGKPTLRGTSLETSFVASLAEDFGEESVVSLYRIDRAALHRAIEFEEAAA